MYIYIYTWCIDSNTINDHAALFFREVSRLVIVLRKITYTTAIMNYYNQVLKNVFDNCKRLKDVCVNDFNYTNLRVNLTICGTGLGLPLWCCVYTIKGVCR